MESGSTRKRTVALSDETTLTGFERDRVAARLDNMRQTLGDDGFEQLIGKTVIELQTLAEYRAPWSTDLAQRGLNAAMLLGLDRLEIACRAIVEQRDDRSVAAWNVAHAATRVLDELV
jgi:hypothetical protein